EAPAKNETAGGIIEDNPEQKIPIVSDDLFPVFEVTLKAIEDFTRKKVRAGLELWLDRVHTAVAPSADPLRPLLVDGVATKSLFGERKGDFDALDKGVEPRKLADAVARVLFSSKDSIDPRNAFPLPVGRKFAWAPEFRALDRENRPSDSSRHQVEVLRLREEL